ncbi:MAG: TonB-dependent receptor [Opitutaceae bacterium]|nr:TonB-dependent receptor [Opitutaceae bacterium]
MSVRFGFTPGLIVASLCGATASAGAAAPTDETRSYHLPRGDAAKLLRQFALLSGTPVLFMMDKVQGEQTNAIDGSYTARAALELMLAGTALEIVKQEGADGFVVSRRRPAAAPEEAGVDPNRQPPANVKPVEIDAGSPALRALKRALALVTIAATAHAGDIVGTVSDATGGKLLPGAAVTILESGRAESTNSSGRFRLVGFTPGTYTVQVSYLGFDTTTAKVTVPEQGDGFVAVRLGSEVVELDRMVVEGYREGRARAMQQKRMMPNVQDLISADSIGNLPDRNVAEAVARVVGVSITGLSQGEGRYVSIRGIDPNLNQIMVDGAVMAAPGGTRLGRAAPLDTLGAGDISQIEVIKSVTPDLDANSLGGTINIRTASAFDRPQRFVSGGAVMNHNESSDKSNLEARLGFSDTFGYKNRWGIAMSGSYDQRDYSNHQITAGWNLRTINGQSVYLPNIHEWKPNEGVSERMGGNLNLEYRPDDATQLYLRTNWSSTERFEHNIEMISRVNNQNVVLTSPTTGTFSGNGTRSQRRDFRSQRDQELVTIIGGLKKEFGAFTFEPVVTYSAAQEERVYDRVLEYRNVVGTAANPNLGTGPVQFDIGAFDFVRWDIDYTIDRPEKYAFFSTRDDGGIVDENVVTAKADLRWDSSDLLGHPGYLKTGVKYLRRDRLSDLISRRLIPAPGTSFTMAQVGTLPPQEIYNRYNPGFLIDHFATWNYIANNPSLTVFDTVNSASNSIEDDYDIDESILAAYLMGSVTVNRLTLLGGLRWEKTEATIRAVEARFAGGTFLGHFPTSGSTRYDKFFPNAQAVYRFSDRLVARASITQTIGRPAYEDTRPLSQFQYQNLGSSALNLAFPNQGSLSIGNPDLQPYEAMSYDVSLEYYVGGSGILSAAGFHKAIDNPIYGYSELRENVVHNGIALETLNVSSVRNADRAELTGLELSLYQPFSFLPAPFDGFGIEANGTFISSEVKVPRRPTEHLPFFRQPSRIYNAALFYERHRFSGRVAWTYSDEALESIGGDVLGDTYVRPRDQVDVQFRYRISQHYAITASVRNVTREPEQRSKGVFQLLHDSRLLGRDYKIGLDFNF